MKLTIDQIKRRSQKAVCAVMEREVVVPKSRMRSVIKTLKSKGYMVIGHSYNEDPVRIWYIIRGGF